MNAATTNILRINLSLLRFVRIGVLTERERVLCSRTPALYNRTRRRFIPIGMTKSRRNGVLSKARPHFPMERMLVWNRERTAIRTSRFSLQIRPTVVVLNIAFRPASLLRLLLQHPDLTHHPRSPEDLIQS